MYKLEIKIPIYQCTVHVMIDAEIEKVINRYVKKYKWDIQTAIKEGEQVHGYAVSNGDVKNYYIFYSVDSLTVNYIAHEIAHLIDYILEEKEIELIGETRAYLTGYISEKIFDFIIKKKLLISKWLKFIQREESTQNQEPVSNQ
jgi:hypothetical protein